MSVGGLCRGAVLECSYSGGSCVWQFLQMPLLANSQPFLFTGIQTMGRLCHSWVWGIGVLGMAACAHVNTHSLVVLSAHYRYINVVWTDSLKPITNLTRPLLSTFGNHGRKGLTKFPKVSHRLAFPLQCCVPIRQIYYRNVFVSCLFKPLSLFP